MTTKDLPPLGKPARRALAGAGYSRLGQFTEVSGAEIAGLHGMGPKALYRIRLALAARGQSFADEEESEDRNVDAVFSSTTRLAAAIRAGEVSATDVLKAHLAQIEKHNSVLNAIVTMDARRARERAREADEALARGEVWGPLHGVPFTLKDAHATEGMRTTTGFPPLDHTPQEDGTVAARLKAAGGILIGKTNVAMMLGDPAQSSNPIFGHTSNPWNLGCTPGGSGGGAAAALASGMTPFEIGTDLAGSIRIPAHFCGLFGLKPTENRTSSVGLIPGLPPPRSIRIMSCIGPMARNVEDLSLLYPIIAGPDGRDTEVQPVPVEDAPDLELKDLRIAYAPTFPGLPVAAEIRGAIEGLAQQFKTLGANVEEATLPDLDFNQGLVYQPGERWMYETGSDVLGVLISRATEQPLETFFRGRIFEPLGMVDTGFHVPADKLDRLPPCYVADPETGALDLYDDAGDSRWSRPPAFESCGGGLVSTVNDYLAFCRMMLNKGKHGGGRILSRPSVELMTTDHLTPEQKVGAGMFFGDDSSWGFGMSVVTRRRDLAKTPGRFGWDGGYGTSGYSDPEEDLIGILMTQRLAGPDSPGIDLDFWTAAYGAIDD